MFGLSLCRVFFSFAVECGSIVRVGLSLPVSLARLVGLCHPVPRFASTGFDFLFLFYSSRENMYLYRYSNFLRTAGTYNMRGPCLVAFMVHYNLKKVVLVSSARNLFSLAGTHAFDRALTIY